MDHIPEEELPIVGEAARSVVRERNGEVDPEELERLQAIADGVERT